MQVSICSLVEKYGKRIKKYENVNPQNRYWYDKVKVEIYGRGDALVKMRQHTHNIRT